jgi:isoleucyl-tRNA synthetase
VIKPTDDSLKMSHKSELDRKLLIEFTKASQEARGKLTKFDFENFIKKVSFCFRTLSRKTDSRNVSTSLKY